MLSLIIEFRPTSLEAPQSNSSLAGIVPLSLANSWKIGTTQSWTEPEVVVRDPAERGNLPPPSPPLPPPKENLINKNKVRAL